MALIYYIDGSGDPVAGGNGYAELSEVDKRLKIYPCWDLKTTEQKENYIISVSAMIDDLMFWGIKWQETQPLQFPRDFSAFDNIDYLETGDDRFNREQQAIILRQAVIQWLIYGFTHSGIGQVSYSIADESFQPRLEIMPREVRTLLAGYWKN